LFFSFFGFNELEEDILKHEKIHYIIPLDILLKKKETTL